ncbi:hypothetical protein FQR65_LT12526 [Abscondita terminalis]|nr:hypothetical protein FQR65_LT12526 [Abscondita terminalis]
MGETEYYEKHLRKANQLILSDHLSNLMDALFENLYFIKFTLNKAPGAEIKTKCECVQPSLGKCSHVTALLLFLFVNENGCKVESVSTPSRIRQWGLRKQTSQSLINKYKRLCNK